jgi:hypothetical protein
MERREQIMAKPNGNCPRYGVEAMCGGAGLAALFGRIPE